MSLRHLDLAAIREWTARNWLSNRAYEAQPLASDVGGRLPCLMSCGRTVSGTAPYCSICKRRTRP